MNVQVRRLGGRLHLVQGSPNTVVAVEDGRGLVVDPGIGGGRGDAVAEALRELGVERLEALVLTHGHTDHLAAAPRLLELMGGGRVYASPLCRGVVEDTVLRRAIVYGGLVSASTASMPMVTVGVDVEAAPGARLPLGAGVLGLPGHTPGSIGVVFEEEKLVAAGDAVLGERVLQRFGVPFALDVRGWGESLQRLRELAEAGYAIVPGHGPVARGKRAVSMVDANLEAVERVKRYVLEKLQAGPLTPDRLAYMATVELGSAEPTPRQVLLNRTALLSVLAWFEEEGKVEPVSTTEGPAWRLRSG